jgi:uncharacterized membrane protein
MTVVIFALLGVVVGGALLGNFGGAVLGGTVGLLSGWVADLAGRVRLLERRLDAARSPVAARDAEPPPRERAAEPAPVSATARAAADERVPETAPAIAEPARPAPPRATPVAAAAPRARSVAQQTPSAAEALLAKAGRWFTTGNVPVKVGVVLSLFGVGFLVKEGIDRQVLVLPIELKLSLVALFGIVLLIVGWRLRTRQRVYALSVQGGGIGVLYLTIYASFDFYQLLPAALAFGLLVAVTAATGVLAVLQDARSLAVLGTFGGFLAPVLASTGSGNHVALFGYYAVLDLAILGIAWFKAWRVLNVLGFLFTFGIGTLWGIDGYRPEHFATTEPFLVLFTLIYLVVPVLFASRAEPRLRGFVDGTLLFGTPVVAFALQSQLVAGIEYGLAISAVVLALVYVGMATYLYRAQRETLRVLVEAQLALGVAFVTVAVPLALDARWTSAAWALQGAALVWLAFRQQRTLALLAGLVLQALSAVAYVEQPWGVAAWPVVNGYTLGALMLALAGFFSARAVDPARAARAPHPSLPDWLAKALSIVLLAWAAGWWLFGGFAEIVRSVGADAQFAAMLGFVAATTLLAVLLASRVAWPRLNWLGAAAWPLAAFFGVVATLALAHPGQGFGWLAWPAVIAAMLYCLRACEAQFGRLAGALHVTAYWLVMGLVVSEARWLVERVADGVWPAAAVLALAAVLVLATLRAVRAVAWPFAAHARAYMEAGCGAVLAALTFATLGLNVDSAGDAAPLTYVPLLNPLELASVLAALALVAWLGALGRHNAALAAASRSRPAVAAAAAWFLVTMVVARTVHHFTGVPYDLDSLAASTTFHSSLSIVWGLAGLAAMVAGARSMRRAVWLVGAGLMVVVVAKLFIVDLGNTGTLARVVSFLGVGLLLLVVGYFAPVPPRADAAVRAAAG